MKPNLRLTSLALIATMTMSLSATAWAKVMLLDEPSLGLSPLLVREIFTIIRRLNREQKVTMMLVEQNAKVALEVSDYGYVMELGRIVMADESALLLESKDIQEFYLGVQGETQRGQKRWKQKKTWR